MDRPTSWITTLPRLMVGLWLAAVTPGQCLAQEEIPVAGDGAFVPEVPSSYSGTGSFFSRQLGTAFRFNYHNEGYGTQEGVVSLGSMKVFAQEGSTFFLDAQATLSDEFGGGFNAGGGYRTLGDLGFGFDPLRIHGVNFWTDGQSTKSDNFFTQLGVGLESLGDSVDLRFQGYFPLERTEDSDTVTMSSIDPFYTTNFLVGTVNQFTRDTALTVLDLEGAMRVLNLEAWAFLGAYQLTGGDLDTTGYRAGVRGYAIPDLALSLQVTEDDIYHTNVMFGITWFVGRTHRLNAPCGTLLDRFREPVLRNDFIATTQSVISAPGDPLTDAVTGDPLFFVHVDSTAGAGGDGTFENPFATLEEAEAGSAENNIVLAHAGSIFAPTQTITLQDDQRWLGEGIPDITDPNSVAVVHTVNTAERGIVELPETAPGSQLLAAPVINAGGIPSGDPNSDMVFELADDDEINNFQINGGTRAVVGTGVDSPRLANLDINDPNGDAIVFTDVTGSSLIENTVTIDNAGGRGIFIDGGSGVLAAIASITDSIGYLIEITGRSGGSVTVGELVQTGVGQGVFVHDNTGGNITFSSFADITTVGPNSAVELENNAGTTISFQQLQATSGDADTFIVTGGGTISVANPAATDPNEAALIENTGTGSALVVLGDADPNADPNSIVGNPTVTVLADVTNGGGGQVVDVQSLSGGSVSITGDVSDPNGDGLGILVQNNTAGTVSFAGAVNLDTDDNSAVVLRNNTGSTINFSNLEATAEDATTFYVKGGGTINVNDPNDTGDINNTGDGTALFVRGNDDPNGVGNPTITIAANVNNGGIGRVVDIQDMTGGGVTISGDVNDPNGDGLGILVQDNTAGTYAFTGDTTIATEGAINAVTLQDNTGATINFTNLNATAVNGNTLAVIGGGTVNVNDPNDDAQLVNTGTGSALFVEGDADPNGAGTGNATVTVAADITNTGGGRAVFIEDMAGGAVSVTGDVTDPNGSDGGGILIQNNTAGTATFTGDVTLATGTTDAVVITGNLTAHTTTFQPASATSQLDIDTTSGDGIVINGAGAVSILGTGHTIDTTMPGGIGMNLTNARSATVNNVTINAGDDAVNIAHDNATASVVTLTGIMIDSAANVGVDIDANGSGQFDIRMNNVDMTSIGDEGIRINTGSSADRVDFTLQNSDIEVGDASGILAILDEANTADVRFLIDPNNEVTNNSGTAGSDSPTVSITVSSGLTLNATIGNGPSGGADPNAPVGPIGDRNRFVNTALGGDAVVITASDGIINLDLRDNTAQADQLEFQLTQELTGTFNLVDATDTINDENNQGAVTTTGTINNIPPPVQQPN